MVADVENDPKRSASTGGTTSDNVVGSGASFSRMAATMGEEGEFVPVRDAQPFRPLGIVALLIGILSAATWFGLALVVIPVVGIIIGLVAIRRYTGERPAGYLAGQIGILLSVFFGVMGVYAWHARQQTLASHAEQFAKDYLSTIVLGEYEVAMELHRNYANRVSAPLKEFYAVDEAGRKAIEEMSNNGVAVQITQIKGQPDWRVSRPTVVRRTFHDRETATVTLVDRQGRVDVEAQVMLDLVRDREGALQWNVMHLQPYRELLVSKSVL